MSSFRFPNLHIPWSHFPKDIYEPSEDTFLLIDALDLDQNVLIKANINVVLEVCCGNGFPVISASFFFETVWSLATDININALKFLCELSQANNVHVETLHSSISFGLRHSSADLLLCNPPYVPSDSNIVTTARSLIYSDSIIDYAWKGGTDGMEFFHAFLPEASRVLRKYGLLYCIVLTEPWNKYFLRNRDYIDSHFIETKVVAKRKSVLETLLVVRFIK